MSSCCKKGEKVSTPLDKDGRDLYDLTIHIRQASYFEATVFFVRFIGKMKSIWKLMYERNSTYFEKYCKNITRPTWQCAVQCNVQVETM